MPPKRDDEDTMIKRSLITVLFGGLLTFGIYIQQSIAGMQSKLAVLEERTTIIPKIEKKLELIYERQLGVKKIADNNEEDFQ